MATHRFLPGVSGNPKGRPKGSRNRNNSELRERLRAFVDGSFEEITGLIESLPPLERLKAYMDLLPYALPKLQSAPEGFAFDQLSDEDLDRIVTRLKEDAQKAA